MSADANRTGDGDPLDQRLAELVDLYAARLQAGEDLSAEAFLAEHPEHAESLRRLLPALQGLADLGVSRVPGRALNRRRARSPPGCLRDRRR